MKGHRNIVSFPGRNRALIVAVPGRSCAAFVLGGRTCVAPLERRQGEESGMTALVEEGSDGSRYAGSTVGSPNAACDVRDRTGAGLEGSP
jgi:hypothetical protein